MILPDCAEVKDLKDAEPGSLISCCAGGGRRLFAISGCFPEEDAGTGAAIFVAELNQSKDARLPHICRRPSMKDKRVVDYGRNWSVDVDIENADPSGYDCVLARSNGAYYLQLAEAMPSFTGGYVNLTTGQYLSDIPLTESGKCVFWDEFKIYVPQEGSLEPYEIFHWAKSGTASFAIAS